MCIIFSVAFNDSYMCNLKPSQVVDLTKFLLKKFIVQHYLDYEFSVAVACCLGFLTTKSFKKYHLYNITLNIQ